MSRATSWMIIEDITLNGISQSSKDKKVHFHASIVSKVVTLIGIRSRGVVTPGKGEWGILQDEKDEKVLEICCTALCID